MQQHRRTTGRRLPSSLACLGAWDQTQKNIAKNLSLPIPHPPLSPTKTPKKRKKRRKKSHPTTQGTCTARLVAIGVSSPHPTLPLPLSLSLPLPLPPPSSRKHKVEPLPFSLLQNTPIRPPPPSLVAVSLSFCLVSCLRLLRHGRTAQQTERREGERRAGTAVWAVGVTERVSVIACGRGRGEDDQEEHEEGFAGGRYGERRVCGSVCLFFSFSQRGKKNN